MRGILGCIAVVALAACESEIPRPAEGQPVERFKLTETSAFGVQTVHRAQVLKRASEICPKGYAALHIGPQITQRRGGVFYSSVTSEVVCAA
jgi:hypothetical protein